MTVQELDRYLKDEIAAFAKKVEKFTGNAITAEKLDGAARGNVWGSYVHGIFDAGGFAQGLVNALLSAKGLTPDAAAVDWETYQEEQYDKLAAGVRASLDMDRVYRILNGEE